MPYSFVDPDRYIGTVTFVTASAIQANMPYATATPQRRALARGAVGDFVFIDCELVKLLGRIIEVRIPDVERLTVEPSLGEAEITHPIGRIQLLASVDQREYRLLRGLRVHPRIGDGVYLADPELFGNLIARAVASVGNVTLEVGTLDAGAGITLRLRPEELFGKHCGIFGATGAVRAGASPHYLGRSSSPVARPCYSIRRANLRVYRSYRNNMPLISTRRA